MSLSDQLVCYHRFRSNHFVSFAFPSQKTQSLQVPIQTVPVPHGEIEHLEAVFKVLVCCLVKPDESHVVPEKECRECKSLFKTLIITSDEPQ